MRRNVKKRDKKGVSKQKKPNVLEREREQWTERKRALIINAPESQNTVTSYVNDVDMYTGPFPWDHLNSLRYPL